MIKSVKYYKNTLKIKHIKQRRYSAYFVWICFFDTLELSSLVFVWEQSGALILPMFSVARTMHVYVSVCVLDKAFVSACSSDDEQI